RSPAVGMLDPLAELLVQFTVVLVDAAVGELCQFVIARQQVDLARKLALERHYHVKQLVGHVTVVRISERAVEAVLPKQVTVRMSAQFSPFEQPAKVLQVTVQVAGCQDLRTVEADRVAEAAGRVATGLGSPAKGVEQALRVGHARCPRSEKKGS